MPRPRVADVAVRTVSVEAVPVAVPLPGDEDELDVCWRACLVMVKKEGKGDSATVLTGRTTGRE